MRRIRLRDPPPLPWVEPSQCVHPNLVALLKFRDSDETTLRCMACGAVFRDERSTKQATTEATEMTAPGRPELWESILSWLDEEACNMYEQWKSATSASERKILCQNWRLAGRLRCWHTEPS